MPARQSRRRPAQWSSSENPSFRSDRRSCGLLSRDSDPSARRLLPLGELQVRLAEPVDQYAHEGLVEADLAGIGGGAQDFSLDLDGGDGLGGDDRGAAPAGIAGEVKDFAKAAARVN